MIITRHLPEGEPRFTGITVTLNGIPVDPPLCRVSAFPYNTPWPGRQRPLDQTEEAAFLGFEADEPVTLHIRWAHPVRELTVRPLARGVQAVPDGNTATVTLPAPGAYTVEADGYHQALHVFFDPIRDFPAVAQGKAHILSFGPGVHEIGCMDLESDTAVLIDRDAYLYGSFRAVCAENIDIFGYGVIDGSREVRTDESRLLLNDYTAPLPADAAELAFWAKFGFAAEGRQLVRRRTPDLTAVKFVQDFLAARLVHPRLCVDATCGNGGDTAFLCGITAPEGKVVGFDVQEAAIASTRKHLEQLGVPASRYELHCQSHADLLQIVQPGTADAVMFNFGWLPGADHAVFSTAQSSIPALQAALEAVRPGGVVSAILYSGQVIGTDEKQTVLEYLRALPLKSFTVLVCDFANWAETAPLPCIILKK